MLVNKKRSSSDGKADFLAGTPIVEPTTKDEKNHLFSVQKLQYMLQD